MRPAFTLVLTAVAVAVTLLAIVSGAFDAALDHFYLAALGPEPPAAPAPPVAHPLRRTTRRRAASGAQPGPHHPSRGGGLAVAPCDAQTEAGGAAFQAGAGSSGHPCRQHPPASDASTPPAP
jgi:hypothetical protein